MVEIIHRYTRAVLYRSEDLTDIAAALVAAVKSGAYLRGAYLRGATVASFLAGGELRGYEWQAYLAEAGVVILRYGCEVRLLPDWRENLPALCRQHVVGRETEYARALSALFGFVETLGGER